MTADATGTDTGTGTSTGTGSEHATDPDATDDGRGNPGKATVRHTSETEDGTPESIGPFRILEELGRGGMGVVYLAEQHKPVRRQVALKVIKQGMDTEQVVARFEIELQALALMDHPAIARVFDAGATPRGRPYIAMEPVRGVPITDHCDRHRLTLRQRLELFLQVCEGVQHAHQKAVIHRDLKPSNVLVAIRDDRPEPKIIDFGIAKAMAQRLTDTTVHTQLGALIGTPAYMSPEQAERTGQDIDTRTDVYALGVILYELLVGARPFEDLADDGFLAMVRRIREEPAPTLSARLTMLGDEGAPSAKRRGITPTALRRALEGDLEWITLKALEKDRTRRYGSPQELAADIERTLSNEPILARPPSALYRIGKLVRRHRGAVASAAMGLVLLIAFAVAMVVQNARVASERDRANSEAVALRTVSDFLKGLFTVADPSEARGNSITARELLDRSVEGIDLRLQEQPETQAELMDTIGDIYQKLGLYEQARPLFERASSTRSRLFGKNHPDALQSRHNLAALARLQARYDEAASVLEDVVDERRRLLSADDPRTLASIHELGETYVWQGRFEEAEALLAANLEDRRRVIGPEHPETASSMSVLAQLYRRTARYDEAESLFREAVELRQRDLGIDHPDTLQSMNGLANAYYYQARYDEATELYRELLELKRRVLGDEHPRTLVARLNLAVGHRALGHWPAAEALYEENVELFERVYGKEHTQTLHNASNLGDLYVRRGRYAEAESLNRQVLETRRRVLGPEHPQTLASLNNVADALLPLGKLDEAEKLYRKCWEAKKRVLGDEHADTLTTRHGLGRLLMMQGRHAEAESFHRETSENRRRYLGADHPETLASMSALGAVLVHLGRTEEAQHLLEAALEKALEIHGPSHPDLGDFRYNLATLAAARGKHQTALELLQLAHREGWIAPWILDDPTLATLHDLPGFQALLARSREALAANSVSVRGRSHE